MIYVRAAGSFTAKYGGHHFHEHSRTSWPLATCPPATARTRVDYSGSRCPRQVSVEQPVRLPACRGGRLASLLAYLNLFVRCVVHSARAVISATDTGRRSHSGGNTDIWRQAHADQKYPPVINYRQLSRQKLLLMFSKRNFST